MFGGHGRVSVRSSGEQRAFSQCVCPAKKAAGTLVDCGHRIVGEQVAVAADDRKMMGQIAVHIVPLESLEQSPADNTGSERARGVKQKPIHEDVLATQDDRSEGALVVGELGKRVQLSQKLKPEEVCFVDNDNRLLFLGGHGGKELPDVADQLGGGT